MLPTDTTGRDIGLYHEQGGVNVYFLRVDDVLQADIIGGETGMWPIGPRRNRCEVAGPAAGPIGHMPGRTPNPQPPVFPTD